jgi:NAD(P)-dependent dehydrogenase (short-subunit alcohol dehydrogenase family)
MKKVVVVTGGAQGIGNVISKEFFAADFEVVSVDKDKEALAEFSKANPGITTIETDVSKENQVKSVIEKVIKKFKCIDCIINNAGFGVFKPVEELSFDEWNSVLSTNLSSIFLFAKYSSRYLRESKGCIINIASTRALMSEPNTESYSASKGGVVAITHALAISLGPDVKVNCISPGWIDVSPYKKSSVRKEESLSEADHKQHPAGRVGVPKDIADVALFLAKQENSFITGQNFVVDGGMTKKMIYV